MKHVTILGLNGASGTMITGPLDIFFLAGRLWNGIFNRKETPFFEVEIVNSDGKPIACLGNISILPTRRMAEIGRSDLILIPSIADLDKTLEYHGDAIPWLRQQYDRGAQIAGMCTGTFFLAETGLLDHKTATTHWGFVDIFRERYPQINLIPERLITDEVDLYCCGASNACFDLALYLVQKMVGREVALQTAKVFICDIDRIHQSEWAVFRFQKSHKDDLVLKAQAIMEKRYAEVNIKNLADRIGISRRSLERRFKAATGETPLKYLHRLRVEAAKRIIETKNWAFDEIAYHVGYENSSYFRKVFTELCHITPKDYRLKWGKVTFPEGACDERARPTH
jgi:transcriptional regulator GlxA family with amidase domain